VDIELFSQVQKVQEALKNKSCTECLQWYSESKSNLKKKKVSLPHRHSGC
jgi:macrophage erythroblast attacher